MGAAGVSCGSGDAWAWLGDLHARPALPFQPWSIGPSPPAFPESSWGEARSASEDWEVSMEVEGQQDGAMREVRLANPGHWSVAQVMHCREAASILEAVRWLSGCSGTPPWEPRQTPRERAEEQLPPTGLMPRDTLPTVPRAEAEACVTRGDGPSGSSWGVSHRQHLSHSSPGPSVEGLLVSPPF